MTLRPEPSWDTQQPLKRSLRTGGKEAMSSQCPRAAGKWGLGLALMIPLRSPE